MTFTGLALPLAHAADPTEDDHRKDFAEWIRAPQEAAPPVSTWRGENIQVRWHGADGRLDDELVKGKPEWREVALTAIPCRCMFCVRRNIRRSKTRKMQTKTSARRDHQ